MTAQGAVFLEALGEHARDLHPEILAQMRSESTTVRSEGRFSRAGSRFRMLTALARPFVGPGMLVTRFGHDVPFSITQRSGRTASGRATLDATRLFRFAGGTQSISDRLTATGRPGIVHNALGDRGRVQLLEECTVTATGALRMRTVAVAVRFGSRRLVLRGILRIRVVVEDGWDAADERRTISMRARNPLLGTILEYRGWYRPVVAADSRRSGG
jgi:hypothetical protein